MNRIRIAAWLCLAALAPSLTGCVGAAAVGAGTGALMFVDRRAAETYLTDEGVEIRAASRLGDVLGRRAHINVTSYNRMALLTGEVHDEAAKAQAEKTVAAVPNVRSIANELRVAGVSSLGDRSNDAYVTSKVKARFIDANKFSPVHVKVITEAGTVYLLGLVTQRESEAAVEIARTTAGVAKVVRMMEIISEEQARQIDNRPPPEPAKKPAPAAQ